MHFDEGEPLLPITLSFEQLPDRPQPIRPVRRRDGAGLFDLTGRMPFGQAEQSHQNANTLNAALMDQLLSPFTTLRTDLPDFAEQMGGTPFNAASLRVRDVVVAGDESAPRSPVDGTTPRAFEVLFRVSRVDGDLLESVVHDAHEAAVPAHPHASSQVLRRDRVVGLVYLDVSVAADLALAFAEQWEAFERQGQQCGPFPLEGLPDLLAGGTVDARVGHLRLPLAQEAILCFETGEGAAPESVLLHIVDSSFHLALVARGARLRGKDHRSVVGGESLNLRIELGIEPVGPGHRRLEIVDDQRLRNAAEVMEGVLQTTDEVLRRLAIHGFAVCLTRMAQHDAKDVGPAPARLRLTRWSLRRPSRTGQRLRTGQQSGVLCG